MEEVAAVSPPIVADDSNGADIATPIVIGVEEANHQIDADDVATVINEEDGLNNVESTDQDGAMESATPVSVTSPSTRRKRGAFSLFRAMFVSFGQSNSIKNKTDCTTSPRKMAIAAAGNDDSPSWKSLVDGVRPLRLRGQELEYYYPPPPPPLGHAADVYHDVLLPPSPARSGFHLEPEAGMTSRYASAQDLHQMDASDEEEDAAAAEGGDGGGGSCPHAIDMQAEEFIAKFYEQFKSESFNGRASE